MEFTDADDPHFPDVPTCGGCNEPVSEEDDGQCPSCAMHEADMAYARRRAWEEDEALRDASSRPGYNGYLCGGYGYQEG